MNLGMIGKAFTLGDSKTEARVHLMPSTPKLSNAFNELSLTQKLKKRMASNVNDEFMTKLTATNTWGKLGKKNAIFDEHGCEKIGIYEQLLGDGTKNSPMKKERQQARD